MRNETIINTIKTVCTDFPYLVQPHEVFLAAMHCFYFMKPSKARDRFVDELEFLFVDTLDEAKRTKANSKMTMRDSMLYEATKRLFIYLTENFDARYFESQIKKIDASAEYGKELVSKYIRTFNKEQLLEYFQLVGGQNFNGRHFIDNEAFYHMWNELNEECTKIDPSVPDMREYIFDVDFEVDFDKLKDVHIICPETGEVLSEGVDTLYFFNYLSTDTIVEIFEKHVNGDMEMLVFLTTAFAACGYKTAMGLTFAMCHYLSNYSVYALDTRKVNPLSDISDRYLDMCVEMAEASRSNKR